MRSRRVLGALALVAVFALVAAGCGGDDTGGDTATPPQAGPLGAVTLKAGEPMKFASIQAISGETASLGTDQVTGMEIAIDDLGGKLLEHDIQLTSLDDGCAAAAGTTAAQRVAADKQIVAVIGTSCSGAAVPAMEILSEAGYTMISGSNTSPILTSAGGVEGSAHKAGYYRTAHNDEIQGRAAATFAFQQLGVTKVATINDGDPYTQGLTVGFEAPFKEFGGQIVVSTAINKGDQDMRPVLTEISAAGAELIFFPIFQPEGDHIVRQAKDIDGLENTVLMGADGLLSDTYMVIPEVHDTPPGAKGTARGMYFSGPNPPAGSAYTDFLAKYKTKAGTDPIQAFHAHGYDALMMFAEAIKKVAVELADGSLFIDRQKLRDAVGATKDYAGITGPISCDQFGDCANPRISVFQATPDHKDIAAVKTNVLYTLEPGQ
ncbi:MAG: branched-chain amino acid ABC transporter substrate-binding protein [Actinomycetota bacterium]